MRKNTESKFKTVLQRNTYYFYNPQFEEEFEAEHISALKQTLLLFREKVEGKRLSVVKREAEKLLLEKDLGLRALLALTGLSNESLKRIITLARVTKDKEFSRLIKKAEWDHDPVKSYDNFVEWGDDKIAQHIRDENDSSLRAGIVNVLAEGLSVPFLAKTLPPFESSKLRLGKLRFDLEEMVDTIVRYKEKGSYSNKPQNNAETAIEAVIERAKISFVRGGLPKIEKAAHDQKRNMDFIIPNRENPKVVIESSYLTTTSSGQGDKAKAEISMRKLLKKHYKKCLFWGFVDGIGWYVRSGDLRRMVGAYDDVFTLAPEEMRRFSKLLRKHVSS